MPFQAEGIVSKNNKIQSLYFLLEIDCPPIATLIQPGQFVMLKTMAVRPPFEEALQSLQKGSRPAPSKRRAGTVLHPI